MVTRFVCVVALTLAVTVPWLAGETPPVGASNYSIGWTAVRPSTVVAGTSAQYRTSVQAPVASIVNVTVTATDANGKTVWQALWPDQSFAAWQGRTFTGTLPTDATWESGPYTVMVRVLDDAGTNLASPRTAAFSVTGSALAAPTATHTPTSAPTTVPTSAPTEAPSATPTRTPTRTPTATPTRTPTVPATQLDSEEADFLRLLNDYRRSRGLGPVAVQANLQQAATWMAADSAARGVLSHVDSLGRGSGQRMVEFGYSPYAWMCEIALGGSETGQSAFDVFRLSPPHNGCMIDAKYVSVGIGRAWGPIDGWRWTVDFGSL